jgi:hypothetical protein
MSAAEDFQLLLGQSGGVVLHNFASLNGEIGSGADEDHGFDAPRLPDGHVQPTQARMAASLDWSRRSREGADRLARSVDFKIELDVVEEYDLAG